jgi:hypothetical protein
MSKKLLGRSNPLLHKLLDLPSPIREHRYRHTPDTVKRIADIIAVSESEQQELIREGWLHLLMDWGIT